MGWGFFPGGWEIRRVVNTGDSEYEEVGMRNSLRIRGRRYSPPDLRRGRDGCDGGERVRTTQNWTSGRGLGTLTSLLWWADRFHHYVTRIVHSGWTLGFDDRVAPPHQRFLLSSLSLLINSNDYNPEEVDLSPDSVLVSLDENEV